MERYSFSKVKCHDNCPLCFYKRYFEKPELENPELITGHGTSEFGSFIHNILEEYENGNLETYELLPYYREHYDEFVVSDFTLKMTETYSKDFSRDYYNSGENYLENFDGFNDFKILEAEYEFEEVVNDSFVFVGKIDLIAEDSDGNLIVIDHKSKASFKNKKEKAEYAMQLYLYAYAVQKKYGKLPTKLMFNMFRKEKWEIFEFNLDDYNSALQWLINSVNNIETSLEFPPIKDTFFCWNFCNYRLANFEECNKGE